MNHTLVLLHGLASNATRWWRLSADWNVPGWTLLTPNLRGHAGSSARGRIGMHEWCDDLARLLDTEGCTRAVIGGHCLGANVALRFAERHPGRTAGLVLIEPMPVDALRGPLRGLPAIRTPLRATAATIRALNRLGLHRRHIESIDLEQWDRAVDSGTLDLSRFASPLSDLKYVPSAAYLQCLVALGEPSPKLAEIQAPALVLLSRRSRMTDPHAARATLQTLPRADFALLDAEHWIPTEQPEAMRAAIVHWLMAHAEPGSD